MKPGRGLFVDLAGQVGQQVVAVDVDLEGLVADGVALLAAARRRPARRRRPGRSAASRGAGRSRWRPTPAAILPGQRTSSGMRNAPSQLVFFSLRNGVIAAVGPGVHVRAVVGAVHDDGVLGDAELVEQVEQLADVLVVVDHGVVVRATASARPGRRSPAWCGSAGACGWCSSSTKNGVPADVLARDEVLGRGRRSRRRSSPSASSSAGRCPRSAACRRGPSAAPRSGRRCRSPTSG